MEQIKSKQRVEDHGEVFTSEREVNAMLDLVRHETERIDSRFLEPACGTGNFLIEILRRKMDVIFDQYRKSQTECEKYLVIGVGSLYGIDLLEDNVQECRERLFQAFSKRYHTSCKPYANKEFENVIRFILSHNIVCGDALTMLDLDGEPIVFSEWSNVTGNLIKRRDFSFSELLRARSKQTSIFDAGWTSQEKKAEFVPNPVKEFKAVHYKELIVNE
ncbi:type III restriction system methylase [methanogenic archaeon mixed culture ISO4-G1]|nr:type III restriction system methylase [methanogenic archaeon mixed culture ISO4-G1]